MENISDYEKGFKVNYSKVARRFNCDRRTVKAAFEKTLHLKQSNGKRPTKVRAKRPSIIDNYAALVQKKFDSGLSAISIYHLIKEKGFVGSYSTVKLFCHNYKKQQVKKATVRFETSSGLQAQVDWKESLTMIDKHGNAHKINIFILLLGYSRYKFLKLTTDRTRDSVMRSLISGFEYFGGVPQEILFDNMRSIVDQSRTQFSNAVFNEEFKSFAKDAGFMPLACCAYRPCTKGKVEAVAHIINQIKVYNGEFEDLNELEEIVKRFNERINSQVHQGTHLIPKQVFDLKERSTLNYVNLELLRGYIANTTIRRTVSKDGFISYNNKKYSISQECISKILRQTDHHDLITVFTNLI